MHSSYGREGRGVAIVGPVSARRARVDEAGHGVGGEQPTEVDRRHHRGMRRHRGCLDDAQPPRGPSSAAHPHTVTVAPRPALRRRPPSSGRLVRPAISSIRGRSGSVKPLLRDERISRHSDVATVRHSAACRPRRPASCTAPVDGGGPRRRSARQTWQRADSHSVPGRRADLNGLRMPARGSARGRWSGSWYGARAARPASS
jgi:hypothetical protein